MKHKEGKKKKKPSTQQQTSATLSSRPYSKDTEKWSTEAFPSAHLQEQCILRWDTHFFNKEKQPKSYNQQMTVGVWIKICLAPTLILHLNDRQLDARLQILNKDRFSLRNWILPLCLLPPTLSLVLWQNFWANKSGNQVLNSLLQNKKNQVPDLQKLPCKPAEVTKLS